MSDEQSPVQKEPHLLFREATDKATRNVGGHMDGFFMVYTYRGALPQERLVTFEIAGENTIQGDVILEAATLYLRRLLPRVNENLAAALAIFNGEIVKKLLTTKPIKGAGGP